MSFLTGVLHPLLGFLDSRNEAISSAGMSTKIHLARIYEKPLEMFNFIYRCSRRKIGERFFIIISG